MTSVLIFGGYGVFGSILARELAARGLGISIVGRDRRRAAALAAQLGPKVRAESADVLDRASCRAALAGHSIAIHAAGPFSEKNTALLEACLESGCHYVDIADDRRYLARVQTYTPDFIRRKLTAVYGCSSLPGVSGALAQILFQEHGNEAPAEIRATLFIGNRNPKGVAALESVFQILGRPIMAPQGMLRGWGDRELVELPAPFGSVAAYNFESADYDLFPKLFGARAVVVKVAFELGIAGRIFSLLSHLPKRLRAALKVPMLALGNRLSFHGSSGGAIQVQFLDLKGSGAAKTLVAPQNGQRMAILPAVLAIEKLLEESPRHGVFSAIELLGSWELLRGLRASGYTLV